MKANSFIVYSNLIQKKTLLEILQTVHKLCFLKYIVNTISFVTILFINIKLINSFSYVISFVSAKNK